MKNLAYYNGRFGELEEMSIPMTDRVCYFGDGVYDATYSRNYKIFALDEHIDRIYNSAALLRIEIAQTKQEMKDILNEMVAKMDTGENFVYWQVTRGGTGRRNHVFSADGAKANLWITISPKGLVDVYKKIKLMTKEDTRFFHCNIKTLNLIPAVIASQEALENGSAQRRPGHRVRPLQCAYHQKRCLCHCPHRPSDPARYRQSPSDQGLQKAWHRRRRDPLHRRGDDERGRSHRILLRLFVPGSRDHRRQTRSDHCGKAPAILKALQDEVLREFMAETE